jgi:hypothetical protein
MVVHVTIEIWGDVLFFSDPGFNSVRIYWKGADRILEIRTAVVQEDD